MRVPAAKRSLRGKLSGRYVTPNNSNMLHATHDMRDRLSRLQIPVDR